MKRLVAQNTNLDDRGNVDHAIEQLKEWGVLTGSGACCHASFERLQALVHERFKIPWTSITPAMERTLYAMVSVNRPRAIVAVGIFCGNTLIWNIGPACGPGACYTASHLVGVELDPKKVDMARDNLRAIGVLDSVELLAADGHEVLRRIDYPIPFLYLDPDCSYKPMLEAAYDKIPTNGVIVAHNTIHKGWLKQETSQEYLRYVRDTSLFRESVSLEPDALGIEVTVK